LYLPTWVWLFCDKLTKVPWHDKWWSFVWRNRKIQNIGFTNSKTLIFWIKNIDFTKSKNVVLPSPNHWFYARGRSSSSSSSSSKPFSGVLLRRSMSGFHKKWKVYNMIGEITRFSIKFRNLIIANFTDNICKLAGCAEAKFR